MIILNPFSRLLIDKICHSISKQGTVLTQKIVENSKKQKIDL